VDQRDHDSPWWTRTVQDHLGPGFDICLMGRLLSEAVKQVQRKGGKVTIKLSTTRLPKQQGDQKGIREERGVVASPSKAKEPSEEERRWWMLTMNSHGIEISIAGCVEEMVHGPNLTSFFYFFISLLFYFIHILNFVSS